MGLLVKGFLFLGICSFLQISMANADREQWFKQQADMALDGEVDGGQYDSPTDAEEVEIIGPKEEEQSIANEDPGPVVPSSQSEVSYDYFQDSELRDASSSFGVGLLSGVLNYPGVKNVQQTIPLMGLGLRYNLGWGINLTGEFMYSYYEIDIQRFRRKDIETMDDYMFGLDVGYDWVNAFFNGVQSYSLITGAVIAHHRRQYNLDENASRSWDAGVFVEGGYRFNDRLMLSLKWRYLENIEFEKDRAYTSQDLNIQTAIADGNISALEEFNSHYYMVSLNYLFY